MNDVTIVTRITYVTRDHLSAVLLMEPHAFIDGVTLAGALDDYLRGKDCPPLGKLFPELRDKIKLNHQILRAAEKFRCNKNGRERRIPTKSPSLQISSNKPLASN
ncbi:hypothetical protein Agabi119p4_2304 [Agaricus bisporus var. burnettii]|uniref:Uncharacterized protein n=1 Tax=Agaricus bisporus var. burnettii TaxID=192524 RepID=A0A8H7KK48_AGABI|nr:hypothetical protein Agabi119p4_2304 [Agaricus bisporus var. burnettii]